MFADISSTMTQYLDFYYRFALNSWKHITPMQYGLLLISIAVVGWALMKRAM